ncbi:MAG TPA: 3-hydroxybutyrate oligomer hydrolase family protein, partial [Casimicrobiaceae bacterium]|nr:3-hydroxybutyrate oligomer hydrolase family protein [Casimicrobiaceae bacterium]
MALHRSCAGKTAIALAAAGILTSCGGGGDGPGINTLPSFVFSMKRTVYDGVSDDLLTGGLGKTGIASATAPTVANATAPTAAELRRLAIYNNYRALVDVVMRGGYGVLYGP